MQITQKMGNKIITTITIICIIAVLIGMYNPFKDKILEARGLKENHCIKEESYYYRIEGWFIFQSKIKTSKENADGIDYKCIEWEEELIAGKSFLGQRLIHNKGNVSEKNTKTKSK